MQHIAIINGPNLNLLGTREVNIYGNQSFDTYLTTLQAEYTQVQLLYYQSNVEGELVNYIHQVGFTVHGIIINPAAYSHTSIAIADAVAAVPVPVIEVHISNIYSREAYRQHSYVSSKVQGVITGLGLHGYKLAVAHLLYHFDSLN